MAEHPGSALELPPQEIGSQENMQQGFVTSEVEAMAEHPGSALELPPQEIGSQENMQQGFVTSEVEAADLCRSSGQCHVLFPPCNPCNEGIRKAVQLPHAQSHRHIFMKMSWNICKMFFQILSSTRLCLHVHANT
ncbi:unnamed protein product [Cladocopium goreaui]|uniref:Uncharacterized protein n=1 Tax=Cladocopium goreaui TaxID=2562237 RepID=A0A9P1G0T5_9DINO|nr:unnamed protein product [Cladocopium goreaui]